MDESWPLSVIAQLAAKPVDRDAHDVSRRRVVVAPHVPGEGIRRDHAVAVPHEVLEESEFGPSEAYLGAVDLQPSLLEIEPQRTGLQDAGLDHLAVDLRAPRERADPCHQLAVEEGLYHVVVRAHVEGAHLVVLAAASGEDEDRDSDAAPAELGEELEPVPGLEVEIDYRHVRVFLLEELERSDGLGRREWDQPGLFYEKGKKVDEFPIVVDEQDPDTLTIAVLGSTHPAPHQGYRPADDRQGKRLVEACRPSVGASFQPCADFDPLCLASAASHKAPFDVERGLN